MHVISGGDTGGAKTHVIGLVNGLNKEIKTLLVTLMESDFTENAKALELPLHVLNQKSRLDLSVTKDIERMVEQERINLIHVHGARANYIATFIKRKHPEIPIVTTIHSDYLLDDYRGGKWLTIIFRKMNERALRKVDYYIGVSDQFRCMMIDRGFTDAKHAFAVYNGIDFSEGDAITRSKKEFLSDHGVTFDPNVTVVGIMGRLDPVKDHYTFIKSAKIILKNRTNVIFLLAGDGALKASLEAYAEELGISKSVHFLGFVKHPYDFYNVIDINVLSSLSESFPYAMLEGARLKKPIVVTDVGGVDKVVKNAQTGYVVPVGSSKHMAERIEYLIEEEELRLEMGENIYQVVMKNYSHEKFIEKHLEIYHKILEEKA
jgi:glycosyltransferase involved in cell wall biosynthesis